MKIVACADLHLDSRLHGLEACADAPVASDGGASRRVLARIVDTCIEERAVALLVAGDLLDRDCTAPSSTAFLLEQVGRLGRAGIRTFLAWGNHDAENELARTIAWPDSVHVFPTELATTATLESEGVRIAVHGRGFPEPAPRENLALGYPAPVDGAVNLGLLHTGLDAPGGHAALAPCTPQDLFAHRYQAWVLGHVHQRRMVADAPCPVLYPGNLQGRWAGETGGKGCTILSIAGGAVAAQEFLDLDDLRWTDEEIDVSGASTLDEVESLARARLVERAVAATGRRLACRVRLHGRTPLHDAIRLAHASITDGLRACAPREVWLEAVLVETARTPA